MSVIDGIARRARRSILGGSRRKLREADKARDARQWSAAAHLYREFLSASPDRADIWVQYGHALKESGMQAEAAYRLAISLNAHVSDFHLQLGHVLKLQGRAEDAHDAYQHAYELDPGSAAAAQELSAIRRVLNIESSWPARLAAPEIAVAALEDEPLLLEGPERLAECVAIDLSDLFFYLRHHYTLSGIQRVQVGITASLLALAGDTGREYKFVVDRGRAYVELPRSTIPRLIDVLSARSVSHDAILRTLAEEEQKAAQFTVLPGDVLVVLGAFWVMENAIERFLALKKRGVRLVVLIHDLIPITHPEFCEASLTDVFTSFCSHVLQISDVVLSVSDHSGRVVANYLRSKNLAVPVIKTLRSAHMTWQPIKTNGGHEPSGKLAQLVSRPYVLYVSTIEIRKNHTMLFRVWKQLIERYGAARVPKLVFVGRPGWRVKDLMDQLSSTRMLGGQIVILHGLSDIELAELYEKALFTTFPSFVEGWGLPVGEGLIHGRPCLASNASSVPEVAGAFVDYCDPNNLDDCFKAYERLILDDDYREQRAMAIQQSFEPRTWTDVTRDLIDILDASTPIGGKNTGTPPIPTLPAGTIINIGHMGDMNHYVTHGVGDIVHFLFDEGWGGIESFGRWQSRRSAHLVFNADKDAGDDINLVLWVDTVEWLGDTSLSIGVNGLACSKVRLPRGRTSPLTLRCPVIDGKIDVAFYIEGPITRGGDPRPLSYGLRALAYAGRGNVQQRIDLAECLLFASDDVMKLEPDA